MFLRSALLLSFFVLAMFIADLSLGTISIPFSQIIKGLFAPLDNEIWSNILMHFRLPRAITAILVGAGLGISGLQMQTLFRNPLAGPFVLGISSGASLGVALLILTGASIGGFWFSEFIAGWGSVLAAGVGAGAVFVVILIVSLRVKDSVGLLIIGIMLASITSAFVGALQYFSDAEQIQVFLIWTLGSLGGVTWGELQVLVPTIISGSLLAFVLFKPLNALLLGENYANSMGVHVSRSRILIIISTCILAGSITAFCGPIAFIGLAVPHLTRLVFNTSDHKKLILLVSLTGALLMLMCDIISQLPGQENVLPINIVTSLVGAPVVIWIIMRRRTINSAIT
jgi:iron complex transport system permease protein